MGNEQVIDIYATGDVVLVVGDPAKGSVTRLRTSSVVLSLGSPVFNAMFRLQFKEGLELTAATLRPIEVPLPDDDVEALKLVCQILHHRHQDVPDTVTIDTLLGVAMLADKYGCSATVKHVLRHWRKLLDNNTDSKTPLVKLSLAAFLLRDDSAFQEIGETLVKHTPGTTVRRSEELPLAMQKYLDHVQNRLEEVHAQVTEAIESRIRYSVDGPRWEDCEPTCRVKEIFTFANIKHLIRIRLWPSEATSASSICTLATRINKYSCPISERMFSCEAGEGDCGLAPAEASDGRYFEESFADDMIAVLRPDRLSCLACVLEEKPEACSHVPLLDIAALVPRRPADAPPWE